MKTAKDETCAGKPLSLFDIFIKACVANMVAAKDPKLATKAYCTNFFAVIKRGFLNLIWLGEGGCCQQGCHSQNGAGNCRCRIQHYPVG